eukprot:TRINITY_DN5151_c0_g2_i2.p1 TRINITY_DN5151_c0_g2~~TRINITY_DN5151_c0_g2_i2.p1  ORF type:complete len:463 (-),score=108.83 TRINITY_DN5151_c0_g2_i2:84-1472(-)
MLHSRRVAQSLMRGGLLQRSVITNSLTRSFSSQDKQQQQQQQQQQQKQSSLSIKPRLDYKYIRDNVDRIKQNIVDRRTAKANPDLVVELYDRHRQLLQLVESIRSARNEIDQSIKTNRGERASLIEKSVKLKEKLLELEVQGQQFESELLCEAMKIPNDTHPDVPRGAEEDSRQIAMFEGKMILSRSDFKKKDHLQLATQMGIVDFESAASTSGSRFYYLKKAGVFLEQALVNYTLQRLATEFDFVPVATPELVQPSILESCGFQPRGEGAQVYNIEDQNLCLIGTSEITLAGLYANKLLSEKQLPIRMAGISRCFRAETGHSSLSSKGLYRVHQFTKVEMFVICKPEDSEAEHEKILRIQQLLFSDIGIPYRVLDMASGDLGGPAYRKYDIESWMPGKNGFGEISSASNCTDYQSRRLNIRYKDQYVFFFCYLWTTCSNYSFQKYFAISVVFDGSPSLLYK